MINDFEETRKTVELFTAVLRAEHGEEKFNASIQEYKDALKAWYDKLVTSTPDVNYMEITELMFFDYRNGARTSRR
jgi:hypothetical protein